MASTTTLAGLATEQGVEATLIEAARRLGYLVAHFRPARTAAGWRTPVAADGAGFPDLVICGYGRLLLVECKSQRGRLAPDQRGWLAALGACGVPAIVVRPAPAADALGLDGVIGMLQRWRREEELTDGDAEPAAQRTDDASAVGLGSRQRAGGHRG